MDKEINFLFKEKKIYVALSPGAGQPKKQWPLENFISIAQEQISKNRVPVFILGPEEVHWHDLLKETVPEALFPLQDHPNLLKNPLYTTALAKYCACSVANDSGTGHLLGLAHAPLISLFGPTASDKLHPYTPEVYIICSQKFGGNSMNDIPLDTVRKTIEEILG